MHDCMYACMHACVLCLRLCLQSGLEEYLACVQSLQQTPRTLASAAAPITRRAHARVGLVGNPSDGFYGKTISVSIENFWAEVSIHESETVRSK